MVTIGSIWGGTFRFIRNNIGPVLIWSGIVLLVTLVSGLAMAPFYQQRLVELQSGIPAQPRFGAMFLPGLIWIALLTILWAAAFRAVFFPEQRRFAYMRLGMDELRLLGTSLILFLGGYIVMLIAGAILIGIGYAVGGGIVAAILGLVLFGAVVWAWTRVSPAGAMTILEHKVVIGPAWRLTRGAFWRLFGAYVLFGILILVVYGIVLSAEMGPILSDLAHPADPEAAARVAQWQADKAHLSVSLVVMSLVSGVLGGFTFAFQAGMIAVATEQLLDRGGATRLNQVFE